MAEPSSLAAIQGPTTDGVLDDSGLAVPRLTIAPGEEPAPRGVARSSGQVWRDEHGAMLATCHTIGGQRWVDVAGVGTFHFNARAVTVTAHPRASVPWAVIREVYDRSVLPIVLQARETEVLHASAVRLRGVVAFCGASGTGKSTLAFALSRRGHPLWADDAVAVGFRDASVVAFPLPFEIHLRAHAAEFFGTVGPTPDAGSLPRSPDRSAAPLAAVCVLSRCEEDLDDDHGVRIERLRAPEAIAALLAQAYCFSLEDPDRKRRMLERYMLLAARVPVFALRFRPRFELLPRVLDQVERLFAQDPA